MRHTILLLIAFMAARTLAQHATTPFSGMADIGCATFSPWCSFTNQAGLADERRPSAGISYRQVMGLSELSTKSAFATLPTRWGIPSVTYAHYGFSDYNEQTIGLAYGRRLGKGLSIGVKADYLFSSVAKQSGSRQTVFFEAGLLVNLPAGITVGAHAYNPGDVAQLSAPEALFVDEKYSFALAWQPDNFFTLSAQTERRKDGWHFAAGGTYTYAEFLTLSCGVKSRTNTFHAGVGVNTHFGELDIIYNTHPKIGNTIGVCLNAKF